MRPIPSNRPEVAAGDRATGEAEKGDARIGYANERWKRFAGPLVVVVVVLLGNALYLVGLTDPNPLGPRAGLAATTISPGPLPGERTIDPNNGFITQAIGRQGAQQIVHGQLPLWNAFEGVGSPLLASPQSAVLFPPTLFNLVPNGLFFETLLLELVAGLATYALMRRLGLHACASGAAGIMFGLNGTFAWLQNGAMLPVAFLPVLLLGVERARDHANTEERGGWLALALALALALYAGFLETVYIYGMLVAAWTTWRLATIAPSHRRRFVMKIAAGLGCGLLLGAVLLIPFADYLSVADIAGHSGAFSNFTLPRAALPTVFGLPYAFGPIFAFNDPHNTLGAVWGNVGGFLSATLVFLSIVGIMGRRDRGLRLLLGGWILFCLAKSFGPHMFVRAVNLLPGMDSVAFYRYMSPALEMAAVILAAFGLDDIFRRRLGTRRLVIAAAITSCLVLVGWAAARGPVANAPGAKRYLVESLVWSFVVVGVVIVAAKLFRGRTLVVVVVATVVADSLLMFALPTLSAPRRVVVDTQPVQWLQAHAGVQRFFTFGPIAANYGSYFDIGSAGATDVPLPQRWSDWLKSRLGPDLDPVNFPNQAAGLAAVAAHPGALRNLGVTYVVLARGGQVGEPLKSSMTLVHRDGVADIYRLSGARPYFDATGGGCAVRAVQRQLARVQCDRASLLVRRELFFPGWKATVNGRSARIRVYDHLFESVDLPPGTSVVRFSYQPTHWPLALMAWLVGVLWVAGELVRRLHARRAPPLGSRARSFRSWGAGSSAK